MVNKGFSERRVVITGLGTINPLGNSVQEYWDNLTLGKSTARVVEDEGIREYNARIMCEVKAPDPAPFFSDRKMAHRLDRYIQFAMMAGTEAIKDSGFDVGEAPHRYGSLVGASGGLSSHYENIGKIHNGRARAVSAFYIVSALSNTGSGCLAKEWNLQGPCFSVASACASANHSIGQSFGLIKMGVADVMVTGGSESVPGVVALVAFDRMGALSRRNDAPEVASRPFDRDRDGFVLSEGAGLLVLEELEHAKKRGAHIYAELTGFGFTSDAYDLAAPHPEGRGAALAMQAALDCAELNPEDLGLINAHATSTPQGDISESLAINTVFGGDASRIPVQATKSMIGHSLGASGGVEAIAALMTFERGIIHSTINQFEQDPQINLNVVKGEPMEAQVDHILSNSFGFGGQNASLVLSRFRG